MRGKEMPRGNASRKTCFTLRYVRYLNNNGKYQKTKKIYEKKGGCRRGFIAQLISKTVFSLLIVNFSVFVRWIPYIHLHPIGRLCKLAAGWKMIFACVTLVCRRWLGHRELVRAFHLPFPFPFLFSSSHLSTVEKCFRLARPKKKTETPLY